MNEMKQIWDVQKCQKSEASMRSTLLNMKHRLAAELATIEEAVKIEYTGWFVLLVKDGDGFKCVGIFNPNTFDEDTDTEPEWELAIPIPAGDTYPEFQGW